MGGNERDNRNIFRNVNRRVCTPRTSSCRREERGLAINGLELVVPPSKNLPLISGSQSRFNAKPTFRWAMFRMYDPANRKAHSVRRKWPTIALVIVAVLIGASTITNHFLPKKPSAWVTELYRYRFAAGLSHFAFLHEVNGGRRDLVVYNSVRQKVAIYRAESSVNIWTLSSNTSKDGAFLIGCSGGITPDQLRAGHTVQTTLFRCQDEKCSPGFDFEGAIDSAVDLGNGELIFIGAKPQIIQRSFPFSPPFSSDFVGYRGSDFYFRARDGRIQRITEWDSSLGLASLGADLILFDSLPSPKSSTPHPPNYLRTSEIWAAKVTYKDGIPHLALDGDRPFIEHGQHLDTKPSISPDGSKTAFLSSSGYTPNNEWRYDIAVVDNASKKELFTVIPEEGSKLSLPVFVDNDRVRFMSFDGAQYSFREISVSAKQEKLLGQVTPEELSHAEVVYLDNAPADRG